MLSVFGRFFRVIAVGSRLATAGTIAASALCLSSPAKAQEAFASEGVPLSRNA